MENIIFLCVFHHLTAPAPFACFNNSLGWKPPVSQVSFGSGVWNVNINTYWGRSVQTGRFINWPVQHVAVPGAVCLSACVGTINQTALGGNGAAYVCRRPERCSPNAHSTALGTHCTFCNPGFPLPVESERGNPIVFLPGPSTPSFIDCAAGGKPTSRARKLMRVSFWRSTCGRKHTENNEGDGHQRSTAQPYRNAALHSTDGAENQPTLCFLQEVC